MRQEMVRLGGYPGIEIVRNNDHVNVEGQEETGLLPDACAGTMKKSYLIGALAIEEYSHYQTTSDRIRLA